MAAREMEAEQAFASQFGAFSVVGTIVSDGPPGVVGVVEVRRGSAGGGRSALAGLERFLTQVQARRLELATETVA
jgi:hypothetical protein